MNVLRFRKTILGGVCVCVWLSACAPSPMQLPAPMAGAVSRVGSDCLPDLLPDPAEPLNRGIWMANQVLVLGVMEPTTRVYRAVLPGRVRQGVRDVYRNWTTPGRVLNQGLQGRWRDGGNESLRFLCNSTMGIGGCFDVASDLGVPRSSHRLHKLGSTYP